jgi:hypothetical protein
MNNKCNENIYSDSLKKQKDNLHIFVEKRQKKNVELFLYRIPSIELLKITEGNIKKKKENYLRLKFRP